MSEVTRLTRPAGRETEENGRSRPCVLTDFDGVWTEVGRQAEFVVEARVSGLAALSGWEESRVEEALARVAAEIAAHPLEHGWWVGDRLTAYADEDPFLLHNGLVVGLDRVGRAGDETCRALTECLTARLAEQGDEDLTALATRLFREGSACFLERGSHDLVPGADEALEALLERADVVFCSNFATEAVAGTLVRHGLDPETTPGLTVRGHARKQVLTGDPAREVSFGGRPVAIDRGHYMTALVEARPDFVVGDVFSLDLALPLTLRREDERFRHTLGVLRRRSDVPAWTHTLVEQEAAAGLVAIDHPRELCALVDALPPRG